MAKKKKSHRRKELDLSLFEENRRYFGKFLCPACKHHWQSTNVWLRVRQRCLKCQDWVFAYDMRPLEKVAFALKLKGDGGEPHPFEACERCISLGYSCTESKQADIAFLFVGNAGKGSTMARTITRLVSGSAVLLLATYMGYRIFRK